MSVVIPWPTTSIHHMKKDDNMMAVNTHKWYIEIPTPKHHFLNAFDIKFRSSKYIQLYMWRVPDFRWVYRYLASRAISIVVEIKWVPFRWRSFQLNYPVRICLHFNSISLKLVQTMEWHRTGSPNSLGLALHRIQPLISTMFWFVFN